MNGFPFVYTPRPGEHIAIGRREDGFVITVSAHGTERSIAILAEEAPGFAVEAARAICEAAGKPEPVILDRPDGQDRNFRAIKIGRNGNAVLLAIGGNQEALSPLLTRELAANLVTLSEEADGEPDPAEVEELAEAIRQALAYPPPPAPPPWPEAAARAALRWMKDKRQRREQS